MQLTISNRLVQEVNSEISLLPKTQSKCQLEYHENHIGVRA